MLELPGVTLVCIDCVEHRLALAAIEQSMLRCRFGEVLFVTDRALPIEEMRVVAVPAIRTYADYSRFVASDLAALVRTPHALLIQWDAFVVNPAAWSEAFFRYDCIAPLPATLDPDRSAEVAGVALLSKRLLRALADPRLANVADLDQAIRQTHRGLLEGELGLAYPPPSIAARFAFGDSCPTGESFAFQGLFNMWKFFQPQDLNAFLAMASPAILATPAALSLAVNLRDLGRNGEAGSVLHAILRAHPDRSLAMAILATIEGAAAPRAQTMLPAQSAGTTGSARTPGRNDPCPCGSGQKFKQCHGRLSGASPVTPPILAPPATAVAFVPRGELAVLFHRARAAFDRGDLAAAEALCRTVLERDPDDAMAIGYLGTMATTARRFAEAEPLLLRAIRLAPQTPDHYNNLGMLHQMRAEFALAASAYRQALSLAADHAPAHNNLGLALQELGQVEEAILAFRGAVRHLPHFAEAHWNLALALLLNGELEEGFAEQEWRLDAARHRDWWVRRKQFPSWTGEPLAGKRLLILAEQGLGDMVQFIRYASELAAHGATVLVEAPPALIDLLRSAPGVAAVVPQDGPYPNCDYQVPVMSLPFFCGTRLDTIAGAPYLAADPSRVVRWQQLLGPKNMSRVGLAWGGNPDHVRDRFRSISLNALMPLLAMPEVEFISLQKGAAAAELAELPPDFTVRDMGRDSRDCADLAALISELDLVITVDTAVAHVAGALGKPLLLLIDTANDWRWMRQRSDSPWYSSAHLIRQPALGDWTGAIAAAKAVLQRRLGA